MADYFRARSTFVCNTGTGLRTVRKDSLVSGDDAAYKNAPHLFQSVSDAVEQATAAPGEKRTLNSPHLLRGAAKKAASSGRRAKDKTAETAKDDGEKTEQSPTQPEQEPETDGGDNTPPPDEGGDGQPTE